MPTRFIIILLCIVATAILACAAPEATAGAAHAANSAVAAVAPPANANPEASILLDVPDVKPPAAPAQTNIAWRIINTIIVLPLILLVAYGVIWVIKRYYQGGRLAIPSAAGGGQPARMMQVVETLTLGPGRFVYLVLVGRRCLLVGASLQYVTLLGDVTDDPEVQDILTRMQRTGVGTVAPVPFANLLNRLLLTQTPDAPPDAPPDARKEPRG